MRTRTKLVLCAGLLAVVVGVVVALRSPTEPVVEVSFVRYEGNAALLMFTNRGRADVKWEFVDGSLFVQTAPLPTNSVCFVAGGAALPAGNDTQVVVLPHAWHDQRSQTLPMVSVVSVQCVPQPSELRRRGEKLLSKIGIYIASTGFVATVNLPPRPTSASPPP